MKVVTAEAMRALDRAAIDEAGIPGAVLMENAGRAVFDVLVERCGPLRGKRVRVECGTGNNGGDGFVVARYSRLAGASVSLGLAGACDRLTGDAATHYRVLRALGVCPEAYGGPYEVKVDALLGTGVKGAPHGAIADAIRRLNETPGDAIAIDIPSGVDADSGATPGEYVRADATVTFAYPKIGLFLPPGADAAGALIVRDIGFEWDSLDCSTPYRWLRPAEMAALIPARPREAHKGMFGHVLIVGGSRGMSGAPTMAARAALRTGAGLVSVAAPESAQALIASKIYEAMTVAVEEQDGALAQAAFDAIVSVAERCDVLCIGPGATQSTGARELMLRLLRVSAKPIVVDADGLNALATKPDALDGRKADAVLTPHPGECARLLGTDAAAIQADRVGAVRKAAERYRAVVVLKGARTLVADGRRAAGDGIPISVNTTGNPGMATGGMGDTLTGIIGSLVGQGLDPYEGACLGAHLHGLAGDIAAESIGGAGLLAGDVGEAIPEAIERLRAAGSGGEEDV